MSEEEIKDMALDSCEEWNGGDEHLYGFIEGFKKALELLNDTN
tara:strand:+ start:786 stop:914 length:129 start_codon:yes stop_codon:yes gene_type:complete